MTKQIAFQQSGRHRRAVHFDHAAIITPTEIMDRAGNQLFTCTSFTEDQHGTVTLRHHFNLFKHAVHGFAAANNLAKFTINIVELLGQGEVFINQPFFQTMDFLIGEGVIDSDCHTFGNLAQQIQIGSGKHFLFALRQFQHAQHGVARHQR